MDNPFLGLALVACLSTLSAQSVTTTFANNNNGAAGGAIYFDLDVGASPGVTINSLSLNIRDAVNTPGSIEIFIRPGTRTGAQLVAGAPWAVTGTPPLGVPVTAAGPGLPTTVPITPIVLPGPGIYGVAVVARGLRHAYTNGNNVNQIARATGSGSPDDLVVRAGEATNVPFTAALLQPRVVNCTIGFQVGLPIGYATSTVYGTGCHTCADSIYELFDPPTTLDLLGAGVQFLPNGGAGYVVVPSNSPFVPPPANANVIALADDAEATIGITSFPYGCGQSTTTLQVCSNGFVSVAANGTAGTPSVGGLLDAAATGWWSWHDYDPSALGSGQVKVHAGLGVLYVTWAGVYDKGTTVPNTFQFQFHASGVVDLVYAGMSGLGSPHLVGFSPGGSSVDFGASDLSTIGVAQLCCTQELPLALAVDRPFWMPLASNFVSAHISNIDLGASVVGIVYGYTNPNFSLQGLGPDWAGCTLFADPLVGMVYVATPSAQSIPVPFFWPVPAVYWPTIHAQAFALGSRSQASNGVALNNGPN